MNQSCYKSGAKWFIVSGREGVINTGVATDLTWNYDARSLAFI